MASRSFLDCPHQNVQQFTELCLDCGHNRYMTKEEYLRELEQQAEKQDAQASADRTVAEIRRLEKKLGIQ